MGNREKLRIELAERSYDIWIGANLIQDSAEIILSLIRSNHIIIVTDKNIANYWLKPLCVALHSKKIRVNQIILPPGEKTKSYLHLQKLTKQLFNYKVSRKTMLIALGGGVVGDITGFAAAITLRGLDYIQIPTTLLSQVDSSVGGKTGINTPNGKNLIGSFHQPRAVISDVKTLFTLPKRQLLAGYAEVIKYGIIADPTFYKWLLGNNGQKVIDGDIQAQCHAIKQSCLLKANIIKVDELENNKRMLLNMGHTFGHALELEAGFSKRLLHGEAVAIGLVMALDLSVKLGLCPPIELKMLKNHLIQIGLPVGLCDIAGTDWSANNLIDNMQQDKKTENGKLTFILTKGIGKPIITQSVDKKKLRELLKKYLNTKKQKV